MLEAERSKAALEHQHVVRSEQLIEMLRIQRARWEAGDVPDHLCVVYDMRLKQYRRFNIELPFNIRSGKDFICAAHTNA